MSHELMEPSLDDTVSVTDVVKFCRSSTGVSSSERSSVVSSTSFSSAPPPTIYFPQSLLTLIHVHYLSRVLQPSLEWKIHEPHRALLSLKTFLPPFFKHVGYVSNHFLESASQAINVFFQRNTFHIVPKDFSPLSALGSLFGAESKSFFLHVDGDFNVDKCLAYSQVLSGLEIQNKSPK
ncbi:hypothetical protein GEMRC1_004956 [Eukaryota sp. GEM-RC1]